MMINDTYMSNCLETALNPKLQRIAQSIVRVAYVVIVEWNGVQICVKDRECDRRGVGCYDTHDFIIVTSSDLFVLDVLDCNSLERGVSKYAQEKILIKIL